jgi:hypothetical protein
MIKEEREKWRKMCKEEVKSPNCLRKVIRIMASNRIR